MQDVMHSQLAAAVERKMDLARREVKRHPHKLWGERDKRDVQHRLPRLENIPVINYDKLEWLCSIDGLKDRTNEKTTDEAHQLFMKNVRSMFVKPPKKHGFPIHSEKRGITKASAVSLCTSRATLKAIAPASDCKTVTVKPAVGVEPVSHDVREHLRLLHKERKSEDPESVKADNLKAARKLLRKLPFDRTAADNEKIFHIMKAFDLLTAAVADNILRELCAVAVLEIWKEDNFTVFGTTGFHVVLRGSVRPLTLPYVSTKAEPEEFRSPTPITKDSDERLTVGSCFGTLKKVEGREPNSKILSVVTTEQNCEFFKVTTSDYARVIEQIHHREQTEKVNLLVSCGSYKLWPRQPLLKVADLIEWMKYPPNTILVSEGYKAPYLAFIRSGECHVLRQVDVIVTLKNGRKEKKTKQVVMGKLTPSDSFAEISLLQGEAITCSVVTATPVELGVITPDKVKELDDVTRQLFVQSNEETFGKLTQDNIEEEYMDQELKREWNQFKHNVVVDVINSRGILPGYGKWSKH